MSYPKITDDDWEVVRDYAAQLSNYSEEQNTLDENIVRENFLEYLRELDQKYGPHPIIYDTIADYLPIGEESLILRLKAYDICNEFDYLQKAFITISISKYFLEDAPDKTKAKFWIDIALKSSYDSEDEDLINESKSLVETINKSD